MYFFKMTTTILTKKFHFLADVSSSDLYKNNESRIQRKELTNEHQLTTKNGCTNYKNIVNFSIFIVF